MLKVYIGYEYGTSIISKLIKYFTLCDITHVFVAFNYGGGTALKYIESSNGGVKEGFLREKKKNKIRLFSFPINQEIDILGLFFYIHKYTNKPYGYLQLFGLAIPSLLERYKIKVKNVFGLGIICSELVWLILKEIMDKKCLTYKNLMLFTRNDVRPDNIYESMIDSDCKEIFVYPI